MPWKRAKALPPPDNTLFDACFRIQREACEAAGRHIPMVVENVKGAQPWVGRAQANFGSYFLWGDVWMVGNRLGCGHIPKNIKCAKLLHCPGRGIKNNGGSWFNFGSPGQTVTNQNPVHQQKSFVGSWDLTRKNYNPNHSWDGTKVPGIKLSEVGFNVAAAQRYRQGVKFSQSGAAWFDGIPRDKMLGDKGPAAYGSKSNSRKAASAQIAKIPFPLAQHVARVFKPIDKRLGKE
jgi:hypothetical protein